MPTDPLPLVPPDQIVEITPEKAEPIPAPMPNLAPVPVPALDWLPSEVRDRGLRFLRSSILHARRTPALLRPALSLEDPAVVCPHVRFAHLSRAGAHTEHELAVVLAFAFGGVAARRLAR